jgi:hypothetical protein
MLLNKESKNMPICYKQIILSSRTPTAGTPPPTPSITVEPPTPKPRTMTPKKTPKKNEADKAPITEFSPRLVESDEALKMLKEELALALSSEAIEDEDDDDDDEVMVFSIG